MYYTIYETKNIINGKLYRGCHITDNLEDNYLGSGSYFGRAIKKYGKENFKKKTLKICKNSKDMQEMEKLYVNEEWVKSPNTYNLQTGGLSNGVLCEESKKKISKSVSNAWVRGDFDNVVFKGRKITEEQKKKISDTLKKRYKTQTHHLKGSIPWNKGKKGTPLSEKAKKKLSIAMKKRWANPENRKKVSDTLKKRYKTQTHHLKGVTPWNKGVKIDDKTRKKISEIIKNVPKVTCPHCFKIVSPGNMARWHGDNCKLNPESQRS